MDSTQRIANIRSKMKDEGVDAYFINRASNVDYATGFDGIHDEENPHAVIITADKAVFLTDSRYIEVAQKQAEGTVWEALCTVKSIDEEVADKLKEFNVETCAMEALLPYKHFLMYEEKCAPITMKAADAWVEKIRFEKSDEEIERIAAAQAVTDRAFTHICEYIKEGMTEREIAVELEYTMKRFGADALAFSSIVASGPNGSLPHCVPGDRKVVAGDFITMDFGAEVAGYKSDMTRTVAVKEISDDHKYIYETVLAANLAGNAAVHAGATGKEVDAAARKVIEDAGFGENFGHGLGHGVGLEIHEGPNASPRSKDTLKAGDIITIEPGIYLPGVCGVRIEDLVEVQAGGARILTQSPKELIFVG